MHAAPQLPLALPYAPSYGREDFVLGPSNASALRLIEGWPAWPARIVLLSGPPGSGKTHLVHVWAASADAEIVEAAPLALEDVVSRLAPGAAVAVENVQPASVPERALFHLINGVQEAGGTLLLSSRKPAEDWAVSLPDLRSRLRLAAPIDLAPPEDETLRLVLVKLFADRQLFVDKPLIDYLVSRMERSLSAAVDLVEALDREALAAGRRITRPMAAQILAGTAEGREFADRQ